MDLSDANSETPATQTSEAWSESSVLGALLFALLLFLLLEIWISRRGGGEVVIQRPGHHKLEYRISINEATAVELTHLPEIGPTLADRIISDRAARGAFADLQDLRRVPGIGPRTIEAIAPYLRWPDPEGKSVKRSD